MAFYEFEGKRPEVHSTAYVHPEATLIGDVVIGENCYVGSGARIRGDWGRVVVGPGSNIQENCVIHSRPGEATVLGPNSHVGHGSILHGPVLEDHAVVGMGAVVMDGARLGSGCLVAAGSVVLAGTQVPPGKVVMGVPGRVTGEVGPDLERELWWGTRLYQGLPERCHRALRAVPGPLGE